MERVPLLPSPTDSIAPVERERKTVDRTSVDDWSPLPSTLKVRVGFLSIDWNFFPQRLFWQTRPVLPRTLRRPDVTILVGAPRLDRTRGPIPIKRPGSADGKGGYFLVSPLRKEKPADQSQRALFPRTTLGFQGLAPANNRRPSQQPGAPALTNVILACQKIRCSELATATKFTVIAPFATAQSSMPNLTSSLSGEGVGPIGRKD